MKTATLHTHFCMNLDTGTALRQWLKSSGCLLRAIAKSAWRTLYFVTKARLLTEHGERRPARRI